MPRHLRLGSGLLLTAMLASCGKDSPLPTGPSEPQPAPTSVELLTTPSCSSSQISALVQQILTGPLGVLVSARLAQLNIEVNAGRSDRARARMFEIVDALVKARNTAPFVNDQTKRDKLDALIRLLFCLLGLPQPPTIGPDGGAAVVTPTSPPTLVQTRTHQAATQVTGAAVPQTVLITVTKITSTSPHWLDTQLDQYGPAWEFTVTPALPQGFNTEVLAGMCFAPTGFPEVDGRLRLAHNNPIPGLLASENARFGNIEIITEVPTDLSQLGLTCSTQQAQSLFQRATSFLLPQFLYAVATPPSSAGKVKNYSPFALVDPLLAVSANSATSQSGTAGAQAGALPSVKVLTAQGNPVNLVPIAFAPGGTVATAGSGTATVGSWLLALGQNTLTATANQLGLSFTGSPVTFTATGFAPASLLPYGAGDWRYTTTAPPSGFTSPGFDDSGWSVSLAPFGYENESDGCTSLHPAFATPWAENGTIYLRRQFIVPTGVTSGSIKVAIDNDLTVWVNGTMISGNPAAHEGCAQQGDFSFPTAVVSGVNTIVVKAVDRGSSTYFDAAFIADPPPVPAGQ